MSGPSGAWLQIRGLSKRFGGAHALTDVDIDIHRGEVHGLVGANGAGKTTLIRILAGVVGPDAGTISIDGEAAPPASPHAAEQAGLAFIHQELNLVPHFNSLENILLGAKKTTRAGVIDWKRSSQAAQQAARRLGITFSLTKPVAQLSVGEQWLVMIAKALVRNASMIAMDEPTASLSDTECERLFGIIRDLARDGVAILYVSHRLDEVLDLCDRITVFRDGRVTHKPVRGDLDKRGLIRAIAGREVEPVVRAPAPEARTGEVLFEARHVTRGRAVRDVSFQLYAGEVLGLGGLVGAGRTELARLAFGADRLDSGSFELGGKPLNTSSVHAAARGGVGLVPEERRSEGLALEKSVAFNMNIAVLKSLRVTPALPLLSSVKGNRRASALAQQLAIKASRMDQPIGSLSGGNQQKALIARWLHPQVKVLFLDEPSRGVDVGARQDIHLAIRELADRGIGVVVISSDVEELAVLCDRVIVMREGRISGVLAGDHVTEEAIVELSYGHDDTLEGARP